MQTTRENLHLEVAVLASLALHVMLLGFVQYRAAIAQFPLFRPLVRILSAILAPPSYTRPAPVPAPQTITFVEAAKSQPPQAEPEPSRQFMETDNRQVTGEQPKDAQYYSDRSTVAANAENPTGKNADIPYLDGKETRVMSTETVMPSPAPSPPAPAVPPSPPPPPNPTAISQAETLAKPAPTPPAPTATATEPPKEVADKGLNAAEEKQFAMVTKQEIASASPPVLPEPSPPAQPQAGRRPEPISPGTGSQREIAAAKSRHIEAGVSRIGVTAFNVADSPFGAYDKQLIRAVQSRWYALIGKYGIYEGTGQVTVTFELYTDGNVGNLKREQNTAGEILALFCEKAISESAPYERLPDNLQVLVGERPREVNFTFYY